MKSRIMPPGYSLEFERKKLEQELREARAGELAGAKDGERKKIEKEVKTEVDSQLKKLRATMRRGGSVLWML